MGACINFEALSDRTKLKHVHDNVHGNIYLEPLFLKFIDTEEFQRQASRAKAAWFVTHGLPWGSAFSGLELGIERSDIEAVKLAGLLHDVGHGPFSHMFEREFLPRVHNGFTWSHEDMSVKMVQHIVDEHHIEIGDECLLKKVKNTTEKHFLYDIVANGRNGIDVDKFDYIVRDSRACGLGCNFQFERLMETMQVMGDEICYRAKDYLTIHKLFATRADLHRTVYTHAKVKAIELMAVDALLKANDHLDIASSIHQPAEFWKLDDSILKRIEISPEPELKEARDLILRIRRRELYEFCNEFSVPKNKMEHFKDITPRDIICSQESGGVPLKEEDIVVSIVKIDLTRGRNNPLQRCYFQFLWNILTIMLQLDFCQDYESKVKIPIQDDRVSHLLPAFYQDMIVRVYAKKPGLVEAVSLAFENFQLKTYGMKPQVHATPESKKRRRQLLKVAADL
uniref:HD domain-containing protein n=1 Tax=Fagus sylvatica TaxID=28930 RepID=A0A2N9ILI2_FAGSY